MIVVAFLLLLPALVDIARRPTFRELAFRNIARRKGEAGLVVVGALLGTAIITASFIVGDTIEASIRDSARTELGPIDVAVRTTDLSQLDELEQVVTEPAVEGTDGALRIVSTAAVAASVGEAPRAEPHAGLVEVDFDAARALGGDPALTGLDRAGDTPGTGEAVINDQLADTLGVGEGDAIEVFAYGGSVELTVRDVLPRVGLAGYMSSKPVDFGEATAAPVFVAPGVIGALFEQSTLPLATPPNGEISVSGPGGLFDVEPELGELRRELAQRTRGLDEVEVVPVKADLLGAARRTGDAIGQLYTGIGGFSVIAGILLLVNLFVMLAEERKSELGMLRAVGFKRNHLVRAFGIEGATYSLVAALLGGGLGILVGWAINGIASRIIESGGVDLAFVFTVKPSTMALGVGTGLAISLVTVWGTSLRISRLNVIRAIRDVPEPVLHRQRLRTIVLASIGVTAGVLIFSSGVQAEAGVPTLAGPAIALFCFIPLLMRFVPRKVAIVVPSALALGYAVFVFALLPDAMGVVGIETFVVQGVILVAAAVTILSTIERAWTGLGSLLSRVGGNTAFRLGLAYPLAKKFRTGMLLGMYAIVIFTMTFMSVFANLFGEQAPTITREVSAGYEIFVDANPGNPVTTEQLEDFEGIEVATPLVQSLPDFKTDWVDAPSAWPMTGFDESLFALRPPGLGDLMPEFVTEEEAFQAVLDDPTLALVPDFFLQNGGGPPDALVEPGDTIRVRNPASGETRDLTVAGIVTSDWVFNGVLVGESFLQEFMGPLASETRHYVGVAEGVDPEQVASELNGAFLANGADATTFENEVDTELAQNLAFFGLMRGFLGLGLLIGIAGLGVVMVRAVRERRRQIGMLRAMGFSTGVVRRSFLLEAAFITLQGSLIGIVLGLLTSYGVLVNSDVFGEDQLNFTIPWVTLAVIFAVPFVASLLATLGPAGQAAKIHPAVALRIAD